MNSFINHTLTLKLFAQSFDCAAYGAGAYNEGQICTTATDGTNPVSTTTPVASSNPLASTGFNMYAGLALGVLLIAAAIGILIKSRLSKKSR